MYLIRCHQGLPQVQARPWLTLWLDPRFNLKHPGKGKIFIASVDFDTWIRIDPRIDPASCIRVVTSSQPHDRDKSGSTVQGPCGYGCSNCLSCIATVAGSLVPGYVTRDSQIHEVLRWINTARPACDFGLRPMELWKWPAHIHVETLSSSLYPRFSCRDNNASIPARPLIWNSLSGNRYLCCVSTLRLLHSPTCRTP